MQLSAALPRPRRLPHPRLPVRWVAALAAVLVVLSAAWLWLRDSPLAEVRQIEITGLSTSQSGDVRAALHEAAMDMTTLHVREEELNDAVRRFSSVAGLRVDADFPHRLHIEVVERHPVAVVVLGGDVVPVGANGRLMRDMKPAQPLAEVKADRIAPGDRITDPKAVRTIDVLSEAPPRLRRRVRRAFSGPKGLTLDVRRGPQLIFGTADDAEMKWMAVARVLAEPAAAGAVYLDVRVPGRVAAGGLGTVEEPEADPVAALPQGASTNPQPQPENTATLNP